MQAQSIQRKLAAVLIADVVGYSKMMERDEDGTHLRMHEIREQIVDPSLAAHDGSVVRTTGDGMLVLFPSATEALQCALQIQRALRDRNQDVAEGSRVAMRMGINLGDIIIEEKDIAGDGVNIAARLETLAEPGGICVSEAVREQVRSLGRVQFEDLGRQYVKNIQRPIHVYQVGLDESRAPQPARWLHSLRRRLVPIALLAVVAIVAVAIVLLRADPALFDRFARRAPPPAMSVRVDDLASPAGEAQVARFAEAFKSNLVARLGLFGGPNGRLRLIAAGPGRAADGAGVQRRDGGDRNVRYVLGGEVERGNEDKTVALRVREAESGNQLWAERTSLRDADAAPDSVLLRQLSERIWAAVVSAETRRVVAQPLASLDPTEMVLRAWDLAHNNETLEGIREAEKLVDDALSRDPGLVFALTSRAVLADYENDVDPRPDHDRIVRALDDYTGRSVSLDPGDPAAWRWRAVALIYMGQWDAALEANARAIGLDPYQPAYYVNQAWLLSVTGRPEQALTFTERALAMKPDNAASALRVACEAHLLLGQPQRAIESCAKSVGLNRNWYIHLILAAAYANQGDLQRAAAEKAEVLRTAPDYTIERLRAKRFSENPDYEKLAEQYWYAGLRKAGFPER